jgi:glyoxylate utilization-related uncharacterized protein
MHHCGKHVVRKHPLVLTNQLARFEVLTAMLLKFPSSGVHSFFVQVVLVVSDGSNKCSAFIYRSNFAFLILKAKTLNFWNMNLVQNLPSVDTVLNS